MTSLLTVPISQSVKWQRWTRRSLKILPALSRHDSLLLPYFYPLHTYPSVMTTHSPSVNVCWVPDGFSHTDTWQCLGTIIGAQPAEWWWCKRKSLPLRGPDADPAFTYRLPTFSFHLLWSSLHSKGTRREDYWVGKRAGSGVRPLKFDYSFSIYITCVNI